MKKSPAHFEDLRGKTVLITGTNRGIGKALVESFNEAGSHVIALFRTEKPECSSDVRCEQGDISDVDSIKEVFERFEKEGVKIDVLVNNAGVYSKCDALNVSEDDFDRTIQTNLKGTFFISQFAAKHMKKNGGGVIINAASFAAKLSSKGYSVYAATKAAIVSLTKSMAAELAPYSIRVNCYSPGVIPTRMTKPAIDSHESAMKSAIALNRFGDADEVAEVVKFLASDASSYITGEDIDVSGGKFVNQNPGSAWQ